uniref:energy-coupling factor transporter transmembrane component T family protein n=1 Tax=Actinotalea sp. C106 TaxID=2908644 RepID=UPI00202881F2
MGAAPPPAPSPLVAPPLAPSWLARCDPSVLLAVVVAVPLVLIRTYEPVPLLCLWAGALLAVRVAAQVPWRRLALAQLPFLSFGLSLVVVNAVTRPGTPVATWWGLEVTDTGLRMGVALAVRTMLIGTCAIGFLAAVRPDRLLSSLHQVARLPVRITAAFLAAHRLLDDLPEEWLTIRRAHAVRHGLVRAQGRRGAQLSRRPADLARAAFVLLVTSIRRAERIAISLESRGLGALDRRVRTVWHPAA